MQQRRGQVVLAWHGGRCVSWPAKAGSPVYTPVNASLRLGEPYKARFVPRTHKLARALLAQEVSYE